MKGLSGCHPSCCQRECRQFKSVHKERGLELIVKSASLKGIKLESREFEAFTIANYCRSTKSITISEREQLCLSMFGDPDADPWIAHFSLGWLMVNKAWDARSGKLAHLVNGVQWELFSSYLEIANSHLSKAWELRPNWPLPGNQLITVAKAGHTDPGRDEKYWYDQVRSVRIDDKSTYDNYLSALSPKWGGSTEGLYDYLDQVIEDSQSFDHMIYNYLSAMSSVSRSTDDQYAVFFKDDYLSHAVRLMKEEIDSRDQSVSDFSFNVAARMVAMGCFLVGDYEDSAFFMRNGGAMTFDSYKGWKTQSRFYSHSMALAPEYSDEVIRAIRSIDDGKVGEAIRILESVHESMMLEPDKEYPNVWGDPVRRLKSKIERYQMTLDGLRR